APIGVMVFAHDVTKRRATQEMLLRDASILSQLQDIVVCLDLERRVTYWNDAAERILGWKREEMLGHPVSDRLPVSVVEEVNSNMDLALAGSPAPPSEWEDYRKDGSRVWIAWRSETLRDGDGTCIGITAVGSDITERRRVEEERKQLEMQLFHAQKMESLGTMAGGIAHDFNNTLAVVLVYSELALASHDLDPSLREGLEQIQRAGTRARDLVARILTFSRTQDLQRTNVDLGALLLDYEKLIRATLPATVQLRVEVGLCGRTLADANQLHQVLLNLCGNAAQAMDDNGILSIALTQQRSPERSLASGMISAGNYAVIEVSDDGRGMSPDTQTRIFEPFFTTKPVGQGTGLGLATAVAIVKNHGGGIDVQSRLGAGATFRIYLPVADSAPVLPSVPVNAPPSGSGQRVLIVDDEEPVAILTRTALQSLGYYAESVFSPEVFLDRFLQAPGYWDLLITDQTMPRITGIELARQLRSLGHDVPILIATGFSRQLTPEALRMLGSSAVLRKPFDIDELARVVGNALLPRAPSAAAPERP
ncbi:MAG TPA: PAS domain S-box protein, partial [Polyangiaceae bacterium]|nr:PAS domain S-box protein [Polyangiaceae bacterium]